jgi:hypothetical protein
MSDGMKRMLIFVLLFPLLCLLSLAIVAGPPNPNEYSLVFGAAYVASSLSDLLRTANELISRHLRKIILADFQFLRFCTARVIFNRRARSPLTAAYASIASVPAVRRRGQKWPMSGTGALC